MSSSLHGGEHSSLDGFLLARLEDEEAAALVALQGILPFESIEQTSDHAARHGPMRVLREVAAKRAMVRLWQDGRQAGSDRAPVPALHTADAMLMALAAVYADHPDFDQARLTPGVEAIRPPAIRQSSNVIDFPSADCAG